MTQATPLGPTIRCIALDWIEAARRRRRVSFEELSHFSNFMATCLDSGLSVPSSLRTSGGRASDSILGQAAERAADSIEQGQDLAESLAPSADRFPPFYVPVIACGERAGRLEETFRYLETHCGQLVRPARAVRNLWLYPAVILAFGWVIQVVAYLAFGEIWGAIGFVWTVLRTYTPPLVIALVAFKLPQTRPLVDRLLLYVPVVGPTIREVSYNRFFHAMALLYSTAGMRVEGMIRMACGTIDNRAVREQLLAAAVQIEREATVTEAFASAAELPGEFLTTIAAGDESGKLERSFTEIAQTTAVSVSTRLAAFQEIFLRLIVLLALIAVIGTIRPLVLRHLGP